MSVSKKIFLIIAGAFFLPLSLFAAGKGFAIVVDQQTYNACKPEIDQYKSMLEREGFSSYIVCREWRNPEEVKNILYGMYRNQSLEGALFIGDIPIPMIRDAQHLTSAFKMDQERFPFRESSVPSDRFYDDFDLQFDYLGQKEDDPLFHYYSLNAGSPQFIKSDIYTGRLKPTLQGEEGYRQIRAYFTKLRVERKKENVLDVITSYTGEGSFSNSMTAWRDQGFLMKEQFPQAFRDKNSAKFLFFAMYPFMKELVVEELRREEMDLMFFHEHGTPDRQYLTATPHSKGTEEYRDAARRVFRQSLKRIKSPEERTKAMEEWMYHYRIDSVWFADAFSIEKIEEDSLMDLRTGIVLDDIPLIAPNARMVIFDACYNGDFREDRYIAGEYIFGGGKTLVTFGNSVNVLQDKSSSDLMGMLGLGFRVGEWAREINILESHIIGDPTFRFSGEKASQIDLHCADTAYWLSVYEREDHPDLKGLALRKLFHLEYGEMPELLVSTYRQSPWHAVRWQVYDLLQHYSGNDFAELIESSIHDPYEFIRRKSVFSMGRIGSDRFIPSLASVYLNDYLDERVHFNSIFTFDLVDMDKLEAEVKRQLEENTSYSDKERVWKEFKGRIDSRKRIAVMADDAVNKEKPLKTRLSAVKMLRNYTYHNRVEDYLKVIADDNEEVSLRMALAEALGWFSLSYKRDYIVEVLKAVAAMPQTPEALKGELLKSIARIEVYMR
ncbi:HEAT repeat domain-containing protein [Proteiniphilum sp. X52]|uniref:HEAT repeat domain-containing protein n=1 Tax=Proteiniphilum sp. X52 TaxID=2382159 RepID=UPI000F09D148|nr:HEAT repeat domain-containing protein [Proteiniphilum sp. X52]RNC66865.1 hypothetical protein D7D25_00965 [Proteiniphilum sp. X52]